MNVATADADRLAEPVLLAALSHYYAQVERRLEGAVNRRAPEVCDAIAAAALDLFLATCEPAARDKLETRRAELVTALVVRRGAIDDAVFDVVRDFPRPTFTGPIGAVFTPLRRVNTMVIGAPGPALEYARVARDQFMTEAPLVDSSSLTWAALDGRNTILYGASSTPLIAELLAEASWQVTPTYVAFGDRKIEGEQLVLIACRARPTDPTLADLVYASANELNIMGINNLHHGPSDFVIGRRNKAGRYQIVMRGSFRRNAEGLMLTQLEK